MFGKPLTLSGDTKLRGSTVTRLAGTIFQLHFDENVWMLDLIQRCNEAVSSVDKTVDWTVGGS